MRKISKTLTLMGLLTPVGANAMGVGEIKLHSALNQVLEAEIPLITSGSESTSDIRVSLASPSAFAKAGIERPYYLSRLQFTPVNKNGRIVVKISSKDVIREPFLNFLIEVDWPQGRMLREFTVLLDPPATFNETAVTATRAPQVQSSTVTKPHYPVDQPSNYGFRPKSPVVPNKASPRKYDAGDYVTSKRNDSLWALADRVNKVSGVSHEQMMVALYEANPHAFFKKNMNALKAGQRLKIPSHESIAKMNRQQALSELATQNAQWRGKPNAPNAEKKQPTQVATTKDASTDKEGTHAPETNLKLVSPSAGESIAKSSPNSAKAAAAGNAQLAIEMAETVSQENEELRARLKEVEEQLARMELMLTLKDKQLNALQSAQNTSGNASEKIIDIQGSQETAENPNTELPVRSDESEVSSVDPAGQPKVPFTVISETEPGESDGSIATNETGEPSVQAPADEANEPPAAVDAQSDPLAAEHQAGVDETTEVEEPNVPIQPATAETETVPVATEVQPEPTSPKPADAVHAPEEHDLLSELLEEPFYLAAGGGALFLLAMVALALASRRKRIIMAGAESILSPSGPEKTPIDNEVVAKKVEPTKDEPAGIVESSFLSEFTPSDFDALETDHDDVDPVSEADVYLAYGRYQQAEDLIRSAIENYPERDECKLKLLEIHFATEDRDAFESYAEELEAYGKEKPEFWAKIAEMGREICPNSALFQVQKTDKQTPTGNEFGDTEFGENETDDFELGGIDDGAIDRSDFGGDELDFEVSDDLTETGDHILFASDSEPEDEPESIEFDEAEDTDDHSIEFGQLDEDVDSDDLTDSAGVIPELDADEPDNDETDLFALDEKEGSEDDGGFDTSREDNIATLEFAKLDLGGSDDVMRNGIDEFSELSDLTDMDEIETKLDLAKAYVDMDDQESARGILSEILVEGNDDQKSEARALVDVLENKA